MTTDTDTSPTASEDHRTDKDKALSIALEKIPPQLRTDKARFVKILNRQKKPFEQGWQKKANYRYDDPELLQHIAQGGNYGYLLGSDDIVVVDVDIVPDLDNLGVLDKYQDWMGLTFATESGNTRGSFHLWFRCPQIKKKILAFHPEKKVMNDEGREVPLVEVLSVGQQVLCPGSIHPSGSKYSVVEDAEIVDVDEAEICKLLDGLRYGNKKQKGTRRQQQRLNSDEGLEENTAPEEQEKIEYPAEITLKALKIMKEGDPVAYLLNTIGRFHIGDKDSVRVFLCCKGTQHVLNSKGLHPRANGESGMGKSDLVFACLHVLDPGCYIKTGMSSKAIFYHNINPQTIIFLDDYKENEDLDSIIKQTSSDFHSPYIHRTVANHEAQTLKAPPEIVWVITSVDANQDVQVLNRQFGVDVDESEATTKKVIEMQIENAMLGLAQREVTEDVLICRAMSQMLQGQKFRVKIPMNWKITWTDTSNRRNPGFFLDLLMAHTAWRFMQRKRDAEDCLIAETKDFEDAREIYAKRGTALKDKLTDKERVLASILVEHKGKLYREEAAQIMKVSPQRITALATGKDGRGGLRQKLSGFAYEDVKANDIKKGEVVTVTRKMLRLDEFEALESFDEGIVKLVIAPIDNGATLETPVQPP